MRWAREYKWHKHFARWKPKESSRNYSFDTFLSEFAQGWVRDLKSPSGTKNYQRDDTNENPRSWLTPLQISINGSLIQEIERLEFGNLQRGAVGFSLKTLLGDLALCEVKRAFKLGGWCWVKPSMKDLYALMVLCCYESTGALWSWTSKEAVARFYQRGKETSKELNRRLRLVLFASFSSLSCKGKTSDFNLFVSKIATRLSGTSSST